MDQDGKHYCEKDTWTRTPYRPWAIWEDRRGEFLDLHIVPMSDSEIHNQSISCACKPHLLCAFADSFIYIHFAHDGRDPFQKLWRALLV